MGCEGSRAADKESTEDDAFDAGIDEESYQTATPPPDSESDCDDESTLEITPSQIEFWKKPERHPGEDYPIADDRALCDKCIALIMQSSSDGSVDHLTDHIAVEQMAIRFVRGHKANGEEAVLQRLRESLEWRRENNVSEVVRSEDQDTHNIFVSGCDRAGHPILWWEVGELAAWTDIDLDRANKLHIRRMERMLSLADLQSRELGVRIYKSTWVVDLKLVGLAHRHTACREAFEAAAAIDDNQYPEVVEKVLLINAPWVFTALWGAISWLVPAETKKKIKLFGSDYYSELEGLVHPECIPVQYGGRNPLDHHRVEHL